MEVELASRRPVFWNGSFHILSFFRRNSSSLLESSCELTALSQNLHVKFCSSSICKIGLPQEIYDEIGLLFSTTLRTYWLVRLDIRLYYLSYGTADSNFSIWMQLGRDSIFVSQPVPWNMGYALHLRVGVGNPLIISLTGSHIVSCYISPDQ